MIIHVQTQIADWWEKYQTRY